MSTAPRFEPISARDYLAGEETARRKHEYVEGVVYAMVGGTVAHNRIATNAVGVLHAQLRRKRCQVFNSDMKVRARTADGTRFYYPDTTVACDLNPASDTFLDAPVVILEVLSDSTRRVDELEKREVYLSIDSLRVYILAEQTTAAATVYRRTEKEFRREHYVGPDSVIPLPEIDCELRLADLYENVEFRPPAAADEDVTE